MVRAALRKPHTPPVPQEGSVMNFLAPLRARALCPATYVLPQTRVQEIVRDSGRAMSATVAVRVRLRVLNIIVRIV